MHSVLPVLQFFAKSSLSHHSWQEPTIAHCWRCFQPRQLYEHRFHKSHHSGSHTSTSRWFGPYQSDQIHILSCPQNTFGAISDVRFSITKYAQLFFSIFYHFFRGVLTSPTQSMSPPAPWWLITSHRCGESLRQLEALRNFGNLFLHHLG